MKQACFSVILFAAALLLASAAEPTAAPATQPYKGWVDIHHPTGGGIPGYVLHYNTLTGASWSRDRTPAETLLRFENPATNVIADYHASTGLIRTGELAPDTLHYRWASHQWTTYQDVLEEYKALLGKVDEAKIVHKKEGDLEYDDFGGLVQSKQGNPISDVFNLPFIIWVNPQSQRIAKASMDGQEWKFTYDGPDITSIYDLGAPRSAEVRDYHAAPATVALFERIEHHASIPFPDGVCMTLAEVKDHEKSLTVYTQTGNNWHNQVHSIKPERTDGALELPPDWTGAGADELFHRLAISPSPYAWLGDKERTILHDGTGESPDSVYTKTRARTLKSRSGPEQMLTYHWIASSRYGLGHRITLTADKNNPSLINVHVQSDNLAGKPQRDTTDFWLDVSRDDRPIRLIEQQYFAKPAAADLIEGAPAQSLRTVVEYLDCAKFPDGRIYPTSWSETAIQTNANGQTEPFSNIQYTFHFFPGRTLPPVKLDKPSHAVGDLP